MRWTGRRWRWVGSGLAVALVSFVVVRTWLVPAMIVSQIRARYDGKVVVGNWWLGIHSSGLDRIALGEGPESDASEWLRADRIEVDVSIASMLRGRFLPTRVTIDRPRVEFRVDAKGQPITRIPLKPGKSDPAKGPASPLPEIVARNAEITFRQEGREPLVLTRVEARLASKEGKERLEVTTDDPNWGKLLVSGEFEDSFKKGEIRLSSKPGFLADPEHLRRIPFIPDAVWANIEPKGPADVHVTIRVDADDPRPVHVLTDIDFRGAEARLGSLQIDSAGTTGRVVVDDAVVRLRDVKGRAIGGTISADGTLDFSRPVPSFDLALRLKDVDVTKAPEAWQLHELGATGRLSGRVDLKVGLPPSGTDLTGTTGVAVIEDGSLQGIPIKSLSVRVKAEGKDLQYATQDQASADPSPAENRPDAPGPVARSGPSTAGPARKIDPARVEIWEPVIAALPIVRMATHDQGFLGWTAYVASELVAYQVEHASGRPGKIQLPKTISTRIELEDVDLTTILAKLEKFGVKVPIPVAGRFSIKARATIPVGSLRDLKGYAFKGDASLSGASIDHVDIGLVAVHVELADGVLDLSDFRGQLVDRPSGDSKNPPKPTVPPAPHVDLTPGGFRGHLRASISPRGPLSVSFEGRALPVGELLAPVLPVPTPLSGDLTVKAEARGSVAELADPRSWTLDAGLESRRISYRGSTIDQIDTRVRLQAARLEVAEFAARLMGQPLEASGSLGLSAPYRFDGRVNLAGWELGEVLAFVPGSPRPAPASGKVDARGQAVGSLAPFRISTQGASRILKARAGPLPLGAVVFQWQTEGDALAISGLEAHPFGGKVTGEARIPTTPGGLLGASMNLKGIDTALLSAALPAGSSTTIAGKADGSLKVSMLLDASTVEAEAVLVAPDLTIHEGQGEGIRVQKLRVNARAEKGLLTYDATADSLGAKLRFHGSAPIAGDLSRVVARAEVQAAGFRLNEAWKGLGISGGLAELDGSGAIDANLRASVRPPRLWANSVFELRDLHYGQHLTLGGLRGTATLSPTTWRIDGVTGELFGGLASGEARGDSNPAGTRLVHFDFKVNRASLPRMLAGIPGLAHGAEGFGSLRASGQIDETLRANAEILVPRARIHGLPIAELRFPADIEVSPTSGVGSVHARHWTAHVAGGMVRGSAWLRLGENRSFQTDLQLNGLDLENLARLQSAGKHSASGKLSGTISLNGPNPNDLAKVRGRVDLDLDEASLVELPVFRELDRFLGSARGGGLFEDGDIHGTIANRTLFVDSLTLEGRLVQLHASGSITFDGGLDLQLLVNTKDVIPQSGIAIVSLIPGLGQALGRSEEVILRLASFLESRLLKFRIGGTVGNPTVRMDTGVAVTQAAAGFFSSALKIPLGGRR